MQRSLALIALFASVLVPLHVFAQPSTEALTLSFSPTHPRPYEEVTVTVGSTLVNLAASDVAISVNGAIIEEGARTANFRVGAPGSRTVVRASVTGTGGTQTVEATLRPADVALIVEPASSAHPFYDGGLLVPSEGRLRIVALADLRTSSGARIANTDISYAWKAGDKQLVADSGLGKNVLTATAPPRYRDTRITVTATSRDQSVTAEASVSISPADPVLRIYAADPLSGTNFSTALTDSFSFAGSEAGFRAVAYFFKDTPSISWFLNSALSGTQDAITVRSGGGSGSAVLSAEALLQDAAAEDTTTLRFESERSGFFGL